MARLTQLEETVLNATRLRGGTMWSDELRYYVREVNPAKFGGVVASLVRKSVVRKFICDGREYFEIID